MISISDFSSLLFRPYVNTNEETVEYIQHFSTEDIIRIQAVSNYNANGYLKNEKTNQERLLLPETIILKNKDIVYTWTIPPETGIYSFNIKYHNLVFTSSRFCVLEDEDIRLRETIKLRYTHRRNERETFFVNQNNYNVYYFDLRFKGMLQYRDIEFSAEDEQFENQEFVPIMMSSSPYFKEILTIGGDNGGVPVWFGHKVNLIFSLSDITINGKQYVRADGSSPEKQDLGDHYPLVVLKLEVSPIDLSSLKSYTELSYLTDNFNVQLTSNFGSLLTENII